QEEDGIRCRNVTGVQTCALPIFSSADIASHRRTSTSISAIMQFSKLALLSFAMLCSRVAAEYKVPDGFDKNAADPDAFSTFCLQIGRASCREILWVSVAVKAFTE